MVDVVVVYDRVATAAAGCKEKVPFGIDISPFSDTLPSSSPRLRQSFASRYPFEHRARSVLYIEHML